MNFDPLWLLPICVLLGLASYTLIAWWDIRRGKVPPLEPDNSIIHGLGDWAQGD